MEAKLKWKHAYRPVSCKCLMLLVLYSTQSHWLRFHCKIQKKGKETARVCKKDPKKKNFEKPEVQEDGGEKLDEDSKNMYEKTHIIHI